MSKPVFIITHVHLCNIQSVCLSVSVFLLFCPFACFCLSTCLFFFSSLIFSLSFFQLIFSLSPSLPPSLSLSISPCQSICIISLHATFSPRIFPRRRSPKEEANRTRRQAHQLPHPSATRDVRRAGEGVDPRPRVRRGRRSRDGVLGPGV